MQIRLSQLYCHPCLSLSESPSIPTAHPPKWKCPGWTASVPLLMAASVPLLTAVSLPLLMAPWCLVRVQARGQELGAREVLRVSHLARAKVQLRVPLVAALGQILAHCHPL